VVANNNQVQPQAPQEPELEASQAIRTDIGFNESDQEIIEQFFAQIETSSLLHRCYRAFL